MPPKKQKVHTVKHKKLGLHILSVSIVTLVLVGGNVLLLLWPLINASYRNNQSINAVASEGRGAVMNFEDSIYLAQNTSEPTLYLRNNTYTTSKVSASDQVNTNKKSILTVQKNSEILGMVSSANKKTIIFSVLNGSGGDAVSVYSYNLEKNSLQNISLTSNNGLSTYRYAAPNTISADGKYVSFNVFSCWRCDGAYPTTAIYDMQTGQTKEIGRTTDFKWLENGMYEYKNFVPEACPVEEIGSGECFKDPTTIAPKKGDWK